MKPRRATPVPFLIAGLALLVWVPSAHAVTPPIITQFCFNKQNQEIEFTAHMGGKGSLTYLLTSSSTQTVFEPVLTGGTVGGQAISSIWHISPGGAPTGQSHTFTMTCTNSNGTTAKQIKLFVASGAPNAVAGEPGVTAGTEYGDGDVCAVADMPGVAPVGLIVVALGILGLSSLVIARTRARGTTLAG
jgi:hypothetical protein